MTLVGRIKARSALQLDARPFLVSATGFAYGQAGYLLADGSVRPARSDVSQVVADAVVMCVAPAGVANGATGLFVRGPVDVPGMPAATPGDLAYVDKTAGTITTVAPT